jgi:hypothetical protein
VLLLLVKYRIVYIRPELLEDECQAIEAHVGQPPLTDLGLSALSFWLLLLQRCLPVSSFDCPPYLIGMPVISATTSTDDIHATQESAQRSGFLSEFHRVAIVKFLSLIQLCMAAS